MRHHGSTRYPSVRRALAASTIGLSALALTACSSGADPKDLSAPSSTFSASAPAPTTAVPNPDAVTSPSPGSIVSSDHVFNFVVPSGWNLTTKDKTVAFLSSATQAHDVAPTIVVSRSAIEPAPALDETVQMAVLQARQDGQTVANLPDRTVGGERALSFSAQSTEKNVPIKHLYVVVAHAKKLYTIVLTEARDDTGGPENALTSLVNSWSWTKDGDKNSTASGTTPAAVPTTTSSSSTSTSPTSASASPSSTSGRTRSSAVAPRSTSPHPTARTTSTRH